MRKWLAILAVLVSLWTTFQVYAQNTETMGSVSVEILPEYDQPAVLVIYHISLSSRTTLPATFNLRIPAGAEVSAVAVSDPVKGLLNSPYERSVQGSWATLKITANFPDIQVEYYGTLDKNGTSRHIVYEWPGDYAVDGFTVALQQPVGATNLVIYPTLLKSSARQDGFTYFASTSQPLPAGQSYTLTVDYQKPTDALSTTGLPVQPVQPLTVATPGRITVRGALPWVLAGLGAILIVVGIVGGFLIWKSGTRNLPTLGRHPPQPTMKEAPNLVYCPKCGKRAQPGDVFCRTCGTRIQNEE
jgi:zinc-ribbon domain